MMDIEAKKMPDCSSLPANVRGYQAMLLDMAQANMQFSFEFAQRLATIRSPIEFLNVIAESTNKRMPCSKSIRRKWPHSLPCVNKLKTKVV
jgi:hypothetical protein